MKKLALLISVVLSMPVFATVYYVTDGDYFGDKTIGGSDSLIMTGGGGLYLTGEDNSILDIRNTSSPVVDGESGIIDVDIWGTSQLYFSGGSVAHISVHSNATAVLSGGQINRLTTSQSAWRYDTTFDPPVLVPNPHVEMIVKDWDYNTTSKMLSGLWGNDSLFNIQLVNISGYSPTIEDIKFTIIPEPASLLLLALGGILLRRKK